MSILDRPRHLMPRVRDASPQLEDPAQFVVFPDIALLDEHYRTSEKNGERVREYIDADQLEIICENTARRIANGDLPLLFVGHTDYKKPETEFPDLVGYVANVRMGLDRRDRPVIMGDFHVKIKHQHVIAEYPRRSVEMFGKQTPAGYIDAVALLKRSPERDLGLVTYSNADAIEYYTCRECREEMGEPMAIEAEDIAAIVQGVVQGMQQWMMQMDTGPEGDLDDDGVPNNMDAEPENSEVGMDESADEAPEEMAAGGGVAGAAPGMPSGTDTMPPPTATMPPKREKTDMSTEEDKIEIAALRRALAKQDARVKALETEQIRTNEQYESAQRKLKIGKVISDHKLDASVDDEVEFAKDLPLALFARHLERMPTLYSKTPDAYSDVPLDRSTVPIRREDTAPESDFDMTKDIKEVQRYAKKEGIDLNTRDGPAEAIAAYLAAKAAKKAGTANGHATARA